MAWWFLGCIREHGNQWEMTGLGWLVLSYCWWLKSCTTWDVWDPINNGINYLPTGAGFLPSTVSIMLPSLKLTVKALKIAPKYRKGSSSNHPFPGAKMLVSGRVLPGKLENDPQILIEVWGLLAFRIEAHSFQDWSPQRFQQVPGIVLPNWLEHVTTFGPDISRQNMVCFL